MIRPAERPTQPADVLTPAGPIQLYCLYQLVGDLWTRKSGHPMGYGEAQKALRPYQARGIAACLFDADAPTEILYSPDAHADRLIERKKTMLPCGPSDMSCDHTECILARRRLTKAEA